MMELILEIRDAEDGGYNALASGTINSAGNTVESLPDLL